MCMLHTPHMCTHIRIQTGSHAGTHSHAYTYTSANTRQHSRIQREAAGAGANTVKLDQNNSIRKLIKCNESPLNVSNKSSTRG